MEGVTALSPKQIISLRDSTALINVWSGAVRSGKTIASLLRFLIAVAEAPPGGLIVVIGRTQDTLARNIFEPLQDVSLFGPLAHCVKYVRGSTSAIVLGRRVEVIGASDAKAEARIRGMTVAICYIDEASLVPFAFWEQMVARMSVAGAVLFATTNPDNPQHWLKKKVIDPQRNATISGRPLLRHWHFTMDDNPSLSVDYVRAMHRLYTGMWYKRFILGEWALAEGAVFDMWDDAHHVVDPSSIPFIERWLAVGIDYGTRAASSAMLLGLGVDGRLYFVDEWRYESGTQVEGEVPLPQLTDAAQSAAIKAWLRTVELPGVNGNARGVVPETIYVDPAAASFRLQLYTDRVGTVRNADNDVLSGIRQVASLLASGDLFVSSKCAGFIGEIAGYAWDTKAADRGEDAVVKTADHSLDAARYAIASTRHIWSPALIERQNANAAT